jgi:hypothetical protein
MGLYFQKETSTLSEIQFLENDQELEVLVQVREQVQTEQTIISDINLEM